MTKMSHANFGEGNYYHIFNRGVEKRLIFLDNNDYWRFMTLLIAFQGDKDVNPLNRLVSLVEHRMFNNEIFRDILRSRNVELVSFCLMPNHFHLILGEIKEGGISKFMQRLLNAYTKYFNIRNKRYGHLFGGKFQSILIEKMEYLNYLTAYIHLNPSEMNRWRGRALLYPWSSYQDFIKENRWAEFLHPEVILDQFGDAAEYNELVEGTKLKKFENNLPNVEHRMFNIGEKVK